MTRRFLRGVAAAVLPLAPLLGRAASAPGVPRPLDGGTHVVRGPDDRV